MAQSTPPVEDQTARTNAEAWDWPDGPARRAAPGHHPERDIPCPEWAEYYELRGDRIRHGVGTTDVLSVRDDVVEGVSVELWQESDGDGRDRRAPLVEFAGLTLDVQQARNLAALLTELCDLAAGDSLAPWPDEAPSNMAWLDACGPLTADERERFRTATARERGTLLREVYGRLAAPTSHVARPANPASRPAALLRGEASDAP